MNKSPRVCFNWGISDHYGWGIYGFNLLMHGLRSEKFQIVPLKNASFLYPLDPITHKLLSDEVSKFNSNFELRPNDILLSALGNSNQKISKNNFRDIGVIFSETNPMDTNEIQKLKDFEFIIAGSSWNANAIEKFGIKTHTVIQGIDLDLFRPNPKKYFKDKFVVFSGGKLEYRKGQDILLKSFSRFASRHKDAVLIAAWRSPWEQQIASSVNHSNICLPLQVSNDMDASIKDWVKKNGVALDQVIFLDATPNRLMPEVLREVDLAVFPNRCEGGTNLVAMEALASGLPCMLSKNTGHLDIIGNNNCIPLEVQSPINGNGCVDWGESSVDEIDDLMEEVYQGRIKIDPSVVRSSVNNFSWENTVNSMLSLF